VRFKKYRVVNSEVREHLAVVERVAAIDARRATACAMHAGQLAMQYQLRRVAARCYRAALELDLFDRDALHALEQLTAGDWAEYARAIDLVDWPRFGCRDATLTLHDDGALVRCPQVGSVLAVVMSDSERIAARPVSRFTGMPLAMALVILRRALWPKAPSQIPAHVHVTFAGHRAVWLDELGDWKDA
jgi:hypothetical protein